MCGLSGVCVCVCVRLLLRLRLRRRLGARQMKEMARGSRQVLGEFASGIHFFLHLVGASGMDVPAASGQAQ
jgi:hypothetical protein